MTDPLRSDPGRGDWLSNVWSYIKTVEERVLGLEHRLRKLELDFEKSDARPIRFTVGIPPQPPLDEE
jgi:hypothetical protein